ncbi:MAG TPA: biopolymer transporter ExbD [Tepidisphaeraceae bacterium]|nr:biopolymer transporter ExbD [Tepidisphaeraceae bacterium]
MKIRGAQKIHYDSGPNMTPLVDVVMVILIFLMLAGSFVGTEGYLVSDLPLRASGGGSVTPPPGGFPQYEMLEIRVDRNATHDGFVAHAGQIQTSDPKVLEAGLSNMREQYTKAGSSLDKVQVIISPGASVRYEHLIEVYQAALKAQFTKIGFSTAR